MNVRIDGDRRWETDPYGSKASEWDPVAGVETILSELPTGVFWAGPDPDTDPALPGPLSSRITPPPKEPVFSWPDTISTWAKEWTAQDSTRLARRDLSAAAARLDQQIADQKLSVHPDVKERLQALDRRSSDRPMLNGTVFFAPLGTPPPGGFEVRTCCPQFMEGDTHNPSCYRTLEEVHRMVPGNRSGGYDDGPCPGPVLRDAVAEKFTPRSDEGDKIHIHVQAGMTLNDVVGQINQVMRAQRVQRVSGENTPTTADDQGADAFDKYVPRGVSAQEAAELRSRLAEHHPHPTLKKGNAAQAAPYAPPPIPDRLRIGHLSYTVTVSDAEINKTNTEDKKEYAGFSTGSEQRIVLREDNPPDYQAETLLHEILHQCLRVTGTDPDADAKAAVEDVEERAVSAMAGPLLGVLRDHPELLAYLTAPSPRDGGD